jgi:hypothetical protein
MSTLMLLNLSVTHNLTILRNFLLKTNLGLQVSCSYRALSDALEETDNMH